MQDNGRHQEEDAGHEAGEGQRHGQAGSTINILNVLAKIKIANFVSREMKCG